MKFSAWEQMKQQKYSELILLLVLNVVYSYYVAIFTDFIAITITFTLYYVCSELANWNGRNSFVRAAPHVSVRLLLCFTAVIYFLFFHFRQPNLGGLLTDLAEIWHADRKLV